jgi:hypothetical protein
MSTMWRFIRYYNCAITGNMHCQVVICYCDCSFQQMAFGWSTYFRFPFLQRVASLFKTAKTVVVFDWSLDPGNIHGC